MMHRTEHTELQLNQQLVLLRYQSSPIRSLFHGVCMTPCGREWWGKEWRQGVRDTEITMPLFLTYQFKLIILLVLFYNFHQYNHRRQNTCVILTTDHHICTHWGLQLLNRKQELSITLNLHQSKKEAINFTLCF